VGILAAVVHFELTVHGVLHYSTDQAGNFWRAFVAFSVGALATYVVSLFTQAKPASELVGLVYSETPRPESDRHLPWYQRPVVFGIIVLALAFITNLFIW